MKTINPTYKCRRCGELDKGHPRTYDSDFLMAFTQAIMGEPSYVSLHVLHPCADGGNGIAELIGHEPPSETA